MTAPVASKVTLPLDTGNTGPKVRTQTRVIGADTVHEHFFVESDPYNVTGMYLSHFNGTVLAAAQNGTSTGFLWVINPVGSTIKALIQRIRAITAATTALLAPTGPRIIGQLFTYTGTPSGAASTIGKTDSTWPAAQHSQRTAMTGMTITLGAIVWSTQVPSSMTAAGVGFPLYNEYLPNHINDAILLRTGEGVAFWQADAGTTSDTRRLTLDLNVEEIETT